jgi:aminoglycoside phosphotransferase family enzyme/predicted kinase
MQPMTSQPSLPPLIRGLLRAGAYSHPVGEIRLLETHISWVILTGPFAYKLKKPVNLGFLDFTSLERRHHFCNEELRLNRRFGSDLYLAVLPVTGQATEPRMGGEEPALDYAVQMRQFDQADLLPAALARGAISAEQIEAFADQLASFHGQAAVATPGTGSGEPPFGGPVAVRAPVLANFHTLLSPGPADAGSSGGCSEAAGALQAEVRQLQCWAEQEFRRLEPRFAERLAAGRVRECHGDLHLGNLVLQEGRIEAFDCLEFSPALRWIDVISDLAFLVMDLQERGFPGLAVRVLNRWLERSGDYIGLLLWRWYLSYRAMVRAKVAALGGQGEQVRAYLQLAEGIGQRRPRLLLLCHGLSGAGKSHHSAALIEPLQAIRIRSDVERKRLFGLWGEALEPARHGDPYAPAVSEELFEQRLPLQAAAGLAAGFSVIVDATFLHRRHRRRMEAVAAEAGVRLLILDCSAPVELLRQRIQARRGLGHDPSDADLAVLEQQRRTLEPLSVEERRRAVAVGPDQVAQATLGALVCRLQAAASVPGASVPGAPVADPNRADWVPTVDPPHPPGCAAPADENGSAGGC